MLQQTAKTSKYQEKKEARIQIAMDTLVIETDPWGTFATVPSTSEKLVVYIVSIDETGAVPCATRCTCKGNQHGAYCVHMIATDRLFARTNMHVEKEQEPTCSISEIEAHADTLMRYGEAQDQQKMATSLEQVIVKAENDLHTPYEAEAAMYEELAPTKNVTVVAGHICQGCCTSYRPEYEEQVFCRRCS